MLECPVFTIKNVVESLSMVDVRDFSDSELALAVFTVEQTLKPSIFDCVARRSSNKVSLGEQLVGDMATNKATDTGHEDPGTQRQNWVVDGRHD